jgi:hypothetical protein
MEIGEERPREGVRLENFHGSTDNRLPRLACDKVRLPQSTQWAVAQFWTICYFLSSSSRVYFEHYGERIRKPFVSPLGSTDAL